VKIRPPLVFGQRDADDSSPPSTRRLPEIKADGRGGHVTPAARALKAFPIEPDALELVSLAENVTYGCRPPRRRCLACGCTRLVSHHDELVSERAWIRALADAGIAVQMPMRTRDGQEYAAVTIPATGERRFAGLARWSTGRVLADVLRETTDTRIAERHFTELGAVTAALHNQAAAWRPPAAFIRNDLDADGFMGDAPHWGPFWDHKGLSDAERRLVLDMRSRLHAALGRLERQPAVYSMIHADMHPGNVLIDGSGLTDIDFDDAAWGWHAYDIAVALVHQQGRSWPPSSRPTSRGYRSVRPISDHVLALVPMFRSGPAAWPRSAWYHQRPRAQVVTVAGFRR
jgi:Ser/Thr protein kinase RdoA (MazF antagonist)